VAVALLAREQRVFDRYSASLAALLAAETGASPGDIEPVVAANALIGLHRALVAYARDRVLAGARNPKLRRDVRAQGRAGLESLARGFGDYAVRADG
jgi:hypothetical protein